MDRITFTVNGKKCSVGSEEVSSSWSLLDYIRETLELRGTKFMCREAGCGACIVNVYAHHQHFSVNTCMVSITSCQDWEISTIEHIGNHREGYHPLQKALANGNGSQCGYCSPGWVMAVYSLLKSNKNMSMLDIEKSLGSNVCRCTGYRPILEVFKKFAADYPHDNKLDDIEDLSICKKTGNLCSQKCKDDIKDWCVVDKSDVKDPEVMFIKLKDCRNWYRVYTVDQIFEVLNKEGLHSYMLVNGNTAKGAYPILEYPRILIDISNVSELKVCFTDQNLVLGAGTTLTEAIAIFDKMGKEDNFKYLKKLSYHITLVANIPVRNIGTIAGNLMIKYQHRFFQSDIFLLLETVVAMLTLQSSSNRKYVVSMKEFLDTDMTGKVILNVLLPPLNDSYKILTFKVMPKAQNAHAIVNAGFLYKLNEDNIVQKAKIVFGGISPDFINAAATESFLFARPLFTNETLQAALHILKEELRAIENPPEPSPHYRKKLALGLFYKGLLTLCPSTILKPCYLSAVERLRESRPVSKANQIIYTHPELWPLTKPIPKVEALIQCAGEAQYVDDMPNLPNQVFAEIVLSNIPKGELVHIDLTKALECSGVIAFYSAKDIPGLNTFTPTGEPLYLTDEELFAEYKIKYFNQPIGVIVAETQHIAEKAARLVEATYKNVEEAIYEIAKAKDIPERNSLFFTSKATERGKDVKKTIKGSTTIFGQYHFCMENIACISNPVENELDIYSTSQYMDGIQITVARLLKIPQNKVNVYIRRLGGAYGLKITRNMVASQSCTLAASKLNRPARIVQSLTSATRALGKRYSCSCDYEIEVDSAGVIQYLKQTTYEDNGFMRNENLTIFAADLFNNLYNKNRWDCKIYDTFTDKAKNTWCRSPGSSEAISMAEFILERISYEVSGNPIDVRFSNMTLEYVSPMREIIDEINKRGHYDMRRADVDKFNLENRWKKRGLRHSLMRWRPMGYILLEVNLSVYHTDGTVVITHGGIEMGQGINTKAIQIAAYFLGIPMEKISIKPNNNYIAPNCSNSGGSLTSQSMSVGVRRCCEQLLSKLEPIRKQLDNPTWEELILRAYQEDVDLQCHGYNGSKDIVNYDIFGACLSEVEIDVLTGEMQVLRVDILEDVGQSISPELDLGQVEGAFIMGLGYWTSEHLVYREHTGELLSNRTWNYYVPQARDIPETFNVYFGNKYGIPKILGAKSIGEPPFCLAISVPFALREAIVSARKDISLDPTIWFNIDGPYTAEQICLSCEARTEDFKFY